MAIFTTGTSLEEKLAEDIRSPRDLPACSTGETLRLPMSFGSVLLDQGAWFRGVVSLQVDIPGRDVQRLHFSPQRQSRLGQGGGSEGIDRRGISLDLTSLSLCLCVGGVTHSVSPPPAPV